MPTKKAKRGNPTEVKTKVETGDSAFILGIFESLKEKRRDMSANWIFCVIEQETWPPLI